MSTATNWILLTFLSMLAACSGPDVLATPSLRATAEEAPAQAWGCSQPQPGHPTAAEKRAFIDEVGGLASKAEQRYGVPAAALVAMVIQESEYGWTRLAQNSHNLLAWKYTSERAAGGRGSWVLDCPGEGSNDRYIVFAGRADAPEFVAAQLASSDDYRAATERYRRDRASGIDVVEAVNRWVDGIADPYSSKAEEYRLDLRRVMNDPYKPADRLSPERNLFRLSEAVPPSQA
jgi:hypothetical protein